MKQSPRPACAQRVRDTQTQSPVMRTHMPTVVRVKRELRTRVQPPPHLTTRGATHPGTRMPLLTAVLLSQNCQDSQVAHLLSAVTSCHVCVVVCLPNIHTRVHTHTRSHPLTSQPGALHTPAHACPQAAPRPAVPLSPRPCALARHPPCPSALHGAAPG